MTIELSIRFTAADEAAPIFVSLFRPDAGVSTNPAAFTPPLDDAILKEIRWYLEVFSTWPAEEDYARAERIEASLEDWGRALRDSLIAEPKAARLWQQFVDDPAEGKQATLDATDPRVLRLPWELLADVGGHIFSQGISVRRRMQQETAAPIRPFALPVRLLTVVSRPDDAGFIDPRAEAKPLLDALAELGDRAAVEFLYPPTLAALTGRLRDRQAPPVHVVHFDGHGVYDASLGLGYLLFEKDDHTMDRVDATRLGTLLNRCGVPLMALNACQSASQEEANPYSSVAARLIRAGVGSVLAMNYSVLVAAARKFVGAFYGGLAAGQTVGQAVDEGRFALLSDESRHTLSRTAADGQVIEQTVRLRDWFLPALYQRGEDPVVFRGGERECGSVGVELPRALTDPNAPGGLPAEPLHGFHGRAREMLALERAFAARPIVVLHGFGGMGKTALAAEAGRWFHRTGRFPGGAAFVSFEHGGSLSQLCSWAGQAISRDPNFVLGEGDPVQRIADLLAERPGLVILDNFESVLGREPLMPAEEVRAVLDAVWLWSGGAGGNGSVGVRERGSVGVWGRGSRVLITTRDTSFDDPRFAPSKGCAHVELGGLAADDALALAAAVLADHGIDRTTVARGDLLALMDRLGGHPLSLYLVLPQLRRHTAAELSARFEELLPGFTAGKAKERNESLAVSLEFSLRRLGDATRAALPDLAVFQGGAMENMILTITQMDADLWKTARAELEGSSLVTAETLPNIQYPHLRFHPTLLPYLSTQLPASRRAELEESYWQAYYQFANFLYQSDTQHPHEARAIAMRELPNLRRGLDLALAAGAAEAAVAYADSVAKFLDDFGRWRERDALMGQIGKLQIANAQGVTKAEFLQLDNRGDALLQAGRAADAEALFRDLLRRLEAGAAYDAAHDHAMTLARLGLCLAAQGRPGQAIEWHRRALGEFERISESSESAKKMSAAAHVDWADNLTAVGQFAEAQEHYEAALPILEKIEDRRSVGVVLGQLGGLALSRGELAEARRRYTEALATFRGLGEPQTEAVAWHQLGLVAQEAKDWDEAERCYRESLKIKEANNDLPGVARTCNQLAIVAVSAGRPADAERWYLRAQQIKDQVSPQDASTLSNLADLYLSQGRLDEAGRYARRAVEIKETLDLSSEPWKTYNILARIAEAQGRPDEAAGWRRKERESKDAYAGTQYELAPILKQFQQVIAAVVAGCQGSEQARAQVAALFDTFRQGNWQIVDAIQRIWAGERDEEALTDKIDYNSRAIVRAILARLTPSPAAAGKPPPQPSPVPTGEGVTLEQLFGLVAMACSPGAPAGLGEQLFGLTRGLAGDSRLPAEIRSLGRVLNKVLAGVRDPDLSALPPDLAGQVRAMLARL